MFYKSDENNFNGIGLGLVISNKIVNALNNIYDDNSINI